MKEAPAPPAPPAAARRIPRDAGSARRARRLRVAATLRSPVDAGGRPAGRGAADRPRGGGDQGRVVEALRNVHDPELGINIVDLGLVYGVDVYPDQVYITYTLTTIACPIGPMIEMEMQRFLADIPGIDRVQAEMVFRPPWTPEMMSEEAKASLGVLLTGARPAGRGRLTRRRPPPPAPRRQEHLERRTATVARFDPRLAPVQLRETGHERQPDPDAGRVRLTPRHLLERLEDREPKVGRDAGALVLDRDQHAVVGRVDPDPDRRALRRVPNRVRDQVLHDPLDLRPVDVGDQRLQIEPRAVHVHRVGVLDHLADERRHVRRAPPRLDDPRAKPIEVQQIGEEPVQLARVRREALEQLAGLLRARAAAPRARG